MNYIYNSDLCVFLGIAIGGIMAMGILFVIEKAIENKYKKMRKEYTNKRKNR